MWKGAMVHTILPGILHLVCLLHVCTSNHTGALFVIVQTLGQPTCLSVRKGLHKLVLYFLLEIQCEQHM